MSAKPRQIATKDQEFVNAELRKCSDDFFYFCRNYIKIIDKQGKIIAFRPNETQLVVYNDIVQADAPYYILKSRKRGVSTFVLAMALWYALFGKNFRYAFIADTEDQAKEIFSKVATFIEHLHPMFKLPGMRANVTRNTVEFDNGSWMRCVSELQADKLRGGDIHMAHFSEFAAYEKGSEAIAAVIGACSEGALQIYETTAKGLGYAHDMWFQDNGWKKRFFPVWSDKDSSRPFPPKVAAPSEFKQRCDEYSRDHKLNRTQRNFLDHKLNEFGRDFRKFHQEFPATPELAFASAKGRVFRTRFEDANDSEGEKIFAEPKPMRYYSLGCDAASGSDTGDFTAYALLDITDSIDNNTGLPELVATGYWRKTPDAIAPMLVDLAKRYNAQITVERTGNGTEIMRRVRETWEEAVIYREVKVNKVGGGPTEMLGFATASQSRSILIGYMHDIFGNRDIHVKIQVPCKRLRDNINNFVYDESGKAQHQAGRHDDMLFAVAMAVAGAKSMTKQEAPRAPPEPISDPWRRERFRKKYGFDAPLPDDQEEEPSLPRESLGRMNSVHG